MVDGSWKYNSLYIRFDKKLMGGPFVWSISEKKLNNTLVFAWKVTKWNFQKCKVELYPILNIHPWYHARKNLVTLPRPSSGNRYIFTVMDLYTKWLKDIAIQNKRSEKVDFELLKIWLRMGFPTLYSNDQRREFVNMAMKNLIDQFAGNREIKFLSSPKWSFSSSFFSRTIRYFWFK